MLAECSLRKQFGLGMQETKSRVFHRLTGKGVPYISLRYPRMTASSNTAYVLEPF